MRAILFLLLALLNISVFATTRTWTNGGGDGLASNSSNWNPSGTPTTGDDIIFDNTSTANCNWNITVVNGVGSFSMNTGYTGTVSCSATTFQYRNNFLINDGTFIAPSTSITRRDFNLNGTFILGGAGTFIQNSGTFILNTLAGTGDVFTFSGAPSFNAIQLNDDPNNVGDREIAFGSGGVSTKTLTDASTNANTGYSGNLNITSKLNFSSGGSPSNASSNTGTFFFNGSGANITGAASDGLAFMPNIVINTTGSYSLSGVLNVHGTWSVTAGTFVAGTSTTNIYSTSGSLAGTGVTFDHLHIMSGAVVSIPSGTNYLTCNGTFSVGGTVSNLSTDGVGFSGTSGFSGTASNVGFIVVKSGGALTLNTGVTILDSLQILGNGSINAATTATLQSTSSKHARIGQLTSGSISGNFFVQTYLPGPTTGWGLLGSPGIQSQNIGVWENYGQYANNINLFMTCNTCSYTPASVGNFTSVMAFDESSSGGFDGTVGVSTPLTLGRGFWFYIGNGASSTSDITLLNTGVPKTGGVTVAPGAAVQSYILLSNPYASAISIDDFVDANGAATGGGDAIYIWDANTGNYAEYSAGSFGSGLISGSMTNTIAAGQGFFAQLGTGGFSFSFTEDMKVPDSGTNVQKPTGNSTIGFKLQVTNTNGGQDGTLFRFLPTAAIGSDGKDADKIFSTPGYMGTGSTYDKYMSISSRMFGEDLSINSLPLLTQSISVPLLVKTGVSGTFTISMTSLNYTSCVVIRDNLDGSLHDMSKGSFVVNISDTTSTPRFDVLICANTVIDETGIEEFSPAKFTLIQQDAAGVTVRTQFPQRTESTISVYNLMGQKLIDDLKVNGTETTTHLPLEQFHDQVVIVRVGSDREIAVKKLVLR